MAGELMIDSGDTAWMLVATALVLLMTPALAFFYGGLVRSKHTLNTMMMSFISLGFVGVLWAVLGYSLAFTTGNALIGDLSNVMLRGVGLEAKGTIPHVLFMAFQGTFAIITAALISGSIVERMRFSAYVTFISLWALLVYSPIAHWVWGGGWLAQWGALDFAGGTVVHVNAAAGAVVAAIVVGKRAEYPSSSLLPHNVPFVLLGSGLLWFGWFGFNAGSALAASPIAGLAFVTTMLAPAATLLVWTIVDVVRSGKPTAVGAATAIVVGLVAITPAAGFISPMSAILLGGIAAIPSYLALQIRAGLGLDPWDVFHQGISDKTGLSFGTIVIITGALVLLAWIPLRQKPGIGTVSNVFVLGIVVDITLAVLGDVHGFGYQLALLTTGVVLNAVAGAAYIGAGLGPGPRDGLMTGFVRTTGRGVGVIRTSIEVSVLAIGFLLGGTVGLGTVVYALSIGPLLQFFLPAFTIQPPLPATA